MDKFLLNAIVFCTKPEGLKKTNFLKFRNITAAPAHLDIFIDYIQKTFPSAQYINFYIKSNQAFYQRIYLN